MSNIPTFNDGDLLGDIRTQSLNPLIEKVNSMVTDLDTATHTADSAADLAGNSFEDCIIDGPNKSITFIKNNGTTHTCNLSPIFDETPAPEYPVYYGFSDTRTPVDAVIAMGSTSQVAYIHGFHVHAMRAIATPQYLFFWKDDRLPEISGFRFNGVLDVWDETPIQVGSNAGKVYVSDYTTGSTSVEYEVSL